MILAILCGILKAVGILLLILLLLVLFVLLVLLFCPVCYEGYSSKETGPIQARAKVSWLWRIVGITAELNDQKKLKLSICLFGISLEKLKERKKKKKSGKKKNPIKKTKAKEKRASVKKEVPELKKLTMKDEPPSKEVPAKNDVQPTNKVPPPKDVPSEKDVQPEKTAGQKGEKRESLFIRIRYRIQTLLKKVSGIPGKISGFFKNTRKTLQGLKQSADHMAKTVDNLQKFAAREDVRQAISRIWEQLIGLVKHVLPRKADGFVTFGTGDPGDTGMILAAAAAVYPFYQKGFRVEPDFQNRVLRYSITFTGRIYGFKVVVSLLRLLIDKNVRFLINVIRKRRK